MQNKLGGRINLYRLSRPGSMARKFSGSILPYRSRGKILTGLDQLERSNFAILRNRNVALLTNATGMDQNLNHILSILRRKNLEPELLLEPEHGMFGHQDWPAKKGLRTDPETGLRILSLYTKNQKRPDARHFAGIDLILVDLQNLPVRCYTYISTLTYLMEMAAPLGIEIMILDRPNPYGFLQAQGPGPVEHFRSFIAYAKVPFLYSLTLGEYAYYMAARDFPDLRVSIIPVRGYKRKHLQANQKLPWLNPSPNIPGLEAALVYPGVVLYEGVNFSLGRGTTRPFVYSGAPWLDGKKVLKALRKLKLPGVEFAPVAFTPGASLHAHKTCFGIQILPRSTTFDPIRTGYEYMRIVRRLHPDKFQFTKRRKEFLTDLLWGGVSYRIAVENDVSWEVFKASWGGNGRKFEKRVKAYRLY